MAQIATITVETAGGPVDLPVYEPGDSGSNRLEAFRVQTASGPGFVPLAAVDEADRPYLRVQTSSGVRAVDTSASGIPDSGISRYKLEQNVSDSWGTNDGVDNTSAGYTTDAASGDYAKQFDGNDWIDLGSANLNPKQMSIAFYVKFSDLSDTRRQVSRWTDPSFAYTTLWTGSEYRFAINTQSGNQYNTDDTSFTPSTGTWYHMTFTFDGDAARIYIDGSETVENTSPSSESIVQDDNGTAIGRDAAGQGSQYHAGDMDDVRLYKKGLTATEVSNLFNTGSITG